MKSKKTNRKLRGKRLLLSSDLLAAALERSIKLTAGGIFQGGNTVAGHIKIGKREYQVTVTVDADCDAWWDKTRAGINAPA
jgi:hypothetical protein